MANFLNKIPASVVGTVLKLNSLLDLALFLDIPAGLTEKAFPLVKDVLTPAGSSAFLSSLRWSFLTHALIRFTASADLTDRKLRLLAIASYLIEVVQVFLTAQSGVLQTGTGPLPLVIPLLIVLCFKKWNTNQRRADE